MNPSANHSLKGFKGQKVAWAEPWDDDTPLMSVDSVPDVTTVGRDAVIEQINKHDLDTDSALKQNGKAKLRTFLCYNYEAFAVNPLAPGCAQVTPHYIETKKDARPARSRAYRASPYSRKVIEDTIDRGLKHNQIEASNSPCSCSNY